MKHTSLCVSFFTAASRCADLAVARRDVESAQTWPSLALI